MVDNETITMTLAIAVALDEIIQKLMYSVVEKDGQKVIVDRELPFRLRYRLNRNRTLLSKDVELFNKRRALLFAQYGEPTEDGQNVTITNEENLAKFKESLSELLDREVSHTFFTLAPEDLDTIQDTDILISPEAMSVFIAYMTDDEEIKKSLRTTINIIPPKEEMPKTSAESITEPISAEDSAIKVEETPVTPIPDAEPPATEEIKEVPVTEEKPKAKAKKTTTKSTSPKKPRAPRKKKVTTPTEEGV